MSKYYTPSIEEFHVGFEYEARIPKMESFSEEVFYFNDSHKKLVNRVTLHDNHVRVKHLDREDIESLGFSNKKHEEIPSEFKYYLIIKDNVFCISTYWHMTRERENLVRIYKGKLHKYPYTEIFRGNVKNKSELKRLLKQLEK